MRYRQPLGANLPANTIIPADQAAALNAASPQVFLEGVKKACSETVTQMLLYIQKVRYGSGTGLAPISPSETESLKTRLALCLSLSDSFTENPSWPKEYPALYSSIQGSIATILANIESVANLSALHLTQSGIEYKSAQAKALASGDLENPLVGPGLKAAVIQQAYAQEFNTSPAYNSSVQGSLYRLVRSKYDKNGNLKSGAQTASAAQASQTHMLAVADLFSKAGVNVAVGTDPIARYTRKQVPAPIIGPIINGHYIPQPETVYGTPIASPSGSNMTPLLLAGGAIAAYLALR